MNMLPIPAPIVPIPLPNDPSTDPVAALQVINANLTQLNASFNANTPPLLASLNAIQDEIRLAQVVHIRIANGFAALTGHAPICYPQPFVAGGALPSTPAEARGLDDAGYTAALLALAGAPGLQPLATNATAAMRRAHLLNYLGIFP
ncbi:hypothetical protein BDZ89DRAFT_1159218 [Hymenopellis radicata]|nr:hypothetical protein BDZ89DRAFT_1159218 [Hymenopellis radicata]